MDDGGRRTVTAADFFVFRTPLLPVEAWTNWSDGVSSPVALANQSGDAGFAAAPYLLG